ncbi:MAG: hypothetical protein BGO25_04195 [Acidobacteriales bacterium 59-55]|jgi:hypothetical protein|uniref:DUF6908 domain-containing protein n=1 Tax=Acidipila rosea TaxID=768535 RepID=A0A4R1L127_9BACT|nr:hypothetical protein [Acidipila rosea]MBN9617127.1 hypothetical protein [Terriglobales bacterium]OJV40344.1 MAG: hypothetical protein BGO25_04195 [Acidobacteriales bacterium 59-55]TCK70697.1 hypothetical protein C7378_3083 [Acidipila rosea]HZY61673.1 hypothetical protein [Edaphobacter sp.]
MQTILRILEKAGGFRPSLYLKIENPPYMALVIEATPEPGPLGLPAISIAHYGKQNGDPMRDPEMCFELSKPIAGKLTLDPYYWRNDYAAVEQFSRAIVRGHYVALLDLHRQHEGFAAEWNKNLSLQGFAEAFTDAAIRG